MSRVLLVKTSSMGDVIHTFPALTDARRWDPEITFDWVVEESFRDLPPLHPAVRTVIPVAVRRWRRAPLRTLASGEIGRFRAALRAAEYDLVIDAQGLIKSAVITRLSRTHSCGYDRRSAREGLAARFYDRRLFVARGQHAVERTRQLFALALSYAAPEAEADYGIDAAGDAPRAARRAPDDEKRVVLIHGSSWESKGWPLQYWRDLATLLGERGFRVLVPWGSEREREDADWIAFRSAHAEVLPAMGLGDLAATLASAAGAVCVDTGLGHLAVALGTPTVALYGPTSPELTGLHGARSVSLSGDHLGCIPCLARHCRLLERGDAERSFPPCFEPFTAERVAERLLAQIDGSGGVPGAESER